MSTIDITNREIGVCSPDCVHAKMASRTLEIEVLEARAELAIAAGQKPLPLRPIPPVPYVAPHVPAWLLAGRQAQPRELVTA